MTKETRQTELSNWAAEEIAKLQQVPVTDIELIRLSGDASFRTYYRAVLPDISFIVVDAPPATEDNETFVRVAEAFRRAGMMTPKVYNVDYQQGFMLQEDFGDLLYLDKLQAVFDAPDKIDRLYKRAIDDLVSLQKNADVNEFAPFDRELLCGEMQLFQDWFCEKFLELTLTDEEQQLIEECMTFLSDEALAQPQVVVHRDYHSRNLMIPNPDEDELTAPAVIDFQDAVSGPYTYDLVSLLRDCYISWPEAYVHVMGLYYLDQARSAGVVEELNKIDANRFFRDFDLVGLQRNLKVMGIFARLCFRDNKPQFLADIPQVIRYFTSVAAAHPEMTAFLDWFNQKILPVANSKLPSGALCEP